MRRLLLIFVSLALLPGAGQVYGATGRVLKVLPHFLDLKGRHALSPSLYDRDAYQAHLRKHPEQRSGVRFDVQWKGRNDAGRPLKLRVELRGIAKGDLPRATVLEKEVTSRKGWSRWTGLAMTGEDYKGFGEVTAWRVTLLDGETVLSSQQSFLW